MKRSLRTALATVAALGLATFAVPALAQQAQHDHQPGDPTGLIGVPAGMMDMMETMMRDAMAGFDGNADGTISPEEMTAGIQVEVQTYDADADGSLSLDEFAVLHAAHMRPMMVRAFQMHDTDGDAKVTEAEMAAMAAMMQSPMTGAQDGMPGMGQDKAGDN